MKAVLVALAFMAVLAGCGEPTPQPGPTFTPTPQTPTSGGALLGEPPTHTPDFLAGIEIVESMKDDCPRAERLYTFVRAEEDLLKEAYNAEKTQVGEFEIPFLKGLADASGKLNWRQVYQGIIDGINSGIKRYCSGIDYGYD